jgi:plasmid stability protein
MPPLLIPDLDDAALAMLRALAAQHARTEAAEARAILTAALQSPTTIVWADVDAFRARLFATGNDFGDSAAEVREDRER